MWRLVCLGLLFVGCSFRDGTFARGDAGDGGMSVVDAPDAPVDSPPDAQECWSTSELNTTSCLMSGPLSGTVIVDVNRTIDTDVTGPGMLECRALRAGSSNVCVIAADMITINAGTTLFANGARPLVLLATTIEVLGTIDVSSRRGGQLGPGANPAGAGNCNAGTNPAGIAGGHGGSFGGKGGDGGDGDGGANAGALAGAAITTFDQLRGGCAGTRGGNTGGLGGAGGGALLLVADAIRLGTAANINASGASGAGAGAGGRGGGGGGTGGMIAFDAGTLMVAATADIWANGGGGGEGSSSGAGAPGGESAAPGTSGGGGTGGSGDGGDGAAGFPSTMRRGIDAAATGGGGGGGGGAGVIAVFGVAVATGNWSPPPS